MKASYEKAVFETMPVPRAVMTLAVPTIISQIVTMIYNLGDTFFVGQIGNPNLFAGKTELDCGLMLQKLKQVGVNRVLLAGGGGMNGSMLASGCVDELSLVVAPLAESDPKAVSLFEASPFAPDFAGATFRLIEAKTMEENALWLHYQGE